MKGLFIKAEEEKLSWVSAMHAGNSPKPASLGHLTTWCGLTPYRDPQFGRDGTDGLGPCGAGDILVHRPVSLYIFLQTRAASRIKSKKCCRTTALSIA